MEAKITRAIRSGCNIMVYCKMGIMYLLWCLFIVGCTKVEEDIRFAVNNKPHFVLFSASWCSPCQNMKRDIQSTNILAGYNVYIIDVDEYPQLKAKYNIESMPTYILFNNGKMVKRKTGYRSIQDLQNFLR